MTGLIIFHGDSPFIKNSLQNAFILSAQARDLNTDGDLFSQIYRQGTQPVFFTQASGKERFRDITEQVKYDTQWSCGKSQLLIEDRDLRRVGE